jgi:CBS domain-containing protein
MRLADCALPSPIVVPPEATLLEAARRLRSANVSSLLVGRPGALVSIITERDLVDAFARRLAPELAVASISAADPLTVPADATLAQAGQRMVEHGIRHLVVTSAEDQAVAVVSMRDVAAAMLSSAAPDAAVAVLCGAIADRPEFWLG